MSPSKKFSLKKTREKALQELGQLKKAVEKKLGLQATKKGGAAKSKKEKHVPISIRLNPKVLDWAKKEAKKKDTKYQTVINETLLKMVK